MAAYAQPLIPVRYAIPQVVDIEQEGDYLICQNCGNRFALDEVEITRGGCNPVPITDEYKTVTDDKIIISKDFLEQATVIFRNWK